MKTRCCSPHVPIRRPATQARLHLAARLSSGVLVVCCALALAFGALRSQAETIYAVTDAGALVSFDSAAPGAFLSSVPITGLQPGEAILGIDFRPATGQLFALGNFNALYTLNTDSGAATLVAPLSVALNGSVFGMDFNPTVDRIRVVSDGEQNLRLNPASGAVTVDLGLAYAAGDANAGADPAVTAVAYLNNTNGATTTTLYGIDSDRDVLVTISPPNNGALNTVGALGVDASAVNGFDISGGSGVAYAALNVGGAAQLYTVNRATGAATPAGGIGPAGTGIRALTVAPAPVGGELIYAVTEAGTLVLFNSVAPQILLRSVAITGLQPAELLLGIDFRPATGELYGLGNSNGLYTLNTNTGAATLVGTPAVALNGSVFGLDFNPVVDRIRVISDAEQNLRLHPVTAAVTVDTSLAFAAADANVGADPGVSAAAYANNTNGATATTLFAIDTTLDVLVTILPPNNGTLNTVGSLGVDVTAVNGFDISGRSGTAYAALAAGAGGSRLSAINLQTGAATLGGFIGPASGIPVIRALSVAPQPAPVADPVITCPNGFVVECAGGLTTVNFSVTASNAAGPVAVTCVPPSGTGFRLGTSNVVCTVNGSSVSCSFPVMVVDTQPPQVTCPGDFSVAATSGAGAAVNYVASASDSCGLADFNCFPAPGSLFAIGATTVTCTASDPVGHSNSCSFVVTVIGNECPTATNLAVSVQTGASVSFQLPAGDADGNPLEYTVTQAPQHGTVVLQVQTGAASYTPTSGYCGPDSFKFRVSDGICNSAEATVSVTVDCGLRPQKRQVLAELAALRAATTDRSDREHLKDAIDNLEDSLANSRWADDNHLTRKGKEVFSEERDAVDELEELLEDANDGDTTIPASVLQGFIDRLVQIDRMLAVISVNEAEAAGAKPGRVAKVREEIADGDADAARGRSQKAIKHYRNAWVLAERLK